MNKENLIKDIKVLKNLALDSSSAYALRIRIVRETLKLLQNISQMLNLPKPDRLEKIEKKLITSNIEDICVLYNSLVETALSLSQPSESLGKRWGMKWENFLNILCKLEVVLKKNDF